MIGPYRHLSDEELKSEIARLSGIVGDNEYEGLTGLTVGKSFDLAEMEQNLANGEAVCYTEEE